jgi:hypothetical protein
MAALLCASTSFAKKSMDEEEMELVTAAGQPAVIIAAGPNIGGVTINADEMGLITQTIDTGSQTNLRALALNNVAGENQVANAVNIQSGVSQTGPLSSQSNEINQSWGATLDWSAVEGTATAASGGPGGDVTVSGGIANVKINCVAVGLGVACAASDVANGGDGGDAKAAATEGFPLSAYADKIIGVIGAVGSVNVSQMNAATVTQSILANSQTTLAALALNNVAGMNQVANGVNIAAKGAVNIGTDYSTAGGDVFPQLKFDAVQNGTGQYNGSQSNLINQYRGTPLSRPCANCAAAPLVPLVPLAAAAQ